MTSVEKYHPMKSKLGVLSRTDGSALLCQGSTTVMAGVYGPVEAKAQKVLIDKANVEMHFKPKSGFPGVGDRFYEALIRNICETALVTALYPRCSVVVVVQEMQNAGEIVACSINAACLALLDSGIDLKFYVGAVSCVLDDEDVLHLNMLPLGQEKSKATFVFAFDSVQKNILASHTTGCFSSEIYEQAVEMCRKQSEHVFEFMRNSVKAALNIT